jgi:hypothetical protein
LGGEQRSNQAIGTASVTRHALAVVQPTFWPNIFAGICNVVAPSPLCSLTREEQVDLVPTLGDVANNTIIRPSTLCDTPAAQEAAAPCAAGDIRAFFG